MLGVEPPNYGSVVINAVRNCVYGAGVKLQCPEAAIVVSLKPMWVLVGVEIPSHDAVVFIYSSQSGAPNGVRMHDGSESRALQYESLRDVGSRTLRGIPAYADAAVVAIGERGGCGIGRAVIGDSPARVANEALCGAAVENRLTNYGAVIVDSVRREGRAAPSLSRRRHGSPFRRPRRS